MAENGDVALEYHPQRTPSPSPPASPKKSGCHVSRKLLPIKGYYFFFMAAVGDLLPFIALFMKQLGLTPQETGVIYGIMPFVGFFIRPVIGAVSDKFKKHKLVLILVTVLSGIFYFLLVFVPVRSTPPNQVIRTKFECNTQDSFFRDCHSIKSAKTCEIGLYNFANSTDFAKFNKSLECSISCHTSATTKVPEFKACFTNDTGPYDADRCNGTLSHRKHLNFVIPDLERLMASEVVRDRDQIGDEECRYYDIKDIEFQFEQGLTHEAWQILCERELELECTVDCGKVEVCTEGSSLADSTFFMFFFLFLLANMAFAPIFPILDAAAYGILAEDRHLWGKQRMWGTFGFAIFVITSTFVMYEMERQNRIDYKVSFYIFLPLCLIAATIAYFIRMSSEIKCGQFLKNVCQLLCIKEVSAFLFIVMYFGMLTGALEAFLFWYLMLLGSSPLVFGFILVVNCCAEVPLLWIAGSIIKKIGLITCLYLALICYGIRMFVYSIIYEPWLVLVVEPLQGVCFGLMYAAASTYASIIAPPGMAATVQGLLGGFHFGFGKGIGSLLTGFMFEGLGPRWTWRVYAIVSLSLLIIYVMLNKFVFSSDHRPSVTRRPAGSERPDEQAKQEENLLEPNSTLTPDKSDPVA